MADALKAEGNALFSAGKNEEAIEKFSAAIEIDPTNHILFSNRSASYASLKQFDKALEDAVKTTELNPTWAKGWTRKGAALHGLGEYSQAREAYEKALLIDPANAQAKSGIKSVSQPPPDAGFDLARKFQDPELINILSKNPRTKEFMKDEAFVAKLKSIQRNETNFMQEAGDTRILTCLGALMGVDLTAEERPIQDESSPEKPAEPAAKREPTPEPEPVDEEALEKKRQKEEAEKEKELGTQYYKKKQFDEAIEHYSKAWELFQDVTYLNNLGAAYLEKGDYDMAITSCQKAIEEGRKVHVDYKVFARAYSRIGAAYEKKGDLASAIANYKSALVENRTPDTLAKLRAAEKAKIAADKAALIDPVKAEEAREKGNALFKNEDWAEALKAYADMIQRAPEDPRGYSNRAACFIKLMQFPAAVDDCTEAIKKDSKFLRAYTRKAQALFGMRRYNDVIDTCDAAEQFADVQTKKELDRQRQKAIQAQFTAREGETEEETMKRIQQDGDIVAILQDPVMQTILQQAKSDPAALQSHLANPQIRSKVQKLIAAGVIRLG